MQDLIKNITNIIGEHGKTWLASLPDTTQTLSDYWRLSALVPIDNMSFHYVTKAIRNSNQPVVLKIGFDKNTIVAEKNALVYFNGNASIQLIDYNEKYNALLLQQAIPGNSLKSIYLDDNRFVIDCYVDTMQRLHKKILPSKHGFRHINDWLKIFDKFKSDKLPEDLLKKAIHLKNALLNSLGPEILLHGDLHHDNILNNQNSYLTIDPKGIIGEPEFEIAAFDFIHDAELTNNLEIKKLFLDRIKMVAEKAHLNAKRIKDWALVRLILKAAWIIEDNGDPSAAIKLAKILGFEL